MNVTSVALVRHQSDGFKPAVQVLMKLSLDELDELKAMTDHLDWDGALSSNALFLLRDLYRQLKGQIPNDLGRPLA